MYKKLVVAGGLAVVSVALVSGQAAGPQRPAGRPLRAPSSWCAAAAGLERTRLSRSRRRHAACAPRSVLCDLPQREAQNRELDAGQAGSRAPRRPGGSGGKGRAETSGRDDAAVGDAAAGSGDARGADRLAGERTRPQRDSRHLPPPGLHRLNRTEYANAIRDLLGLEVDATKFLPSDDSTYGFDNMAGALGMSPALMEAYLSAAGKISRLAIGSVTAPTMTRVQRAARAFPRTTTSRVCRSGRAAAS